MAIEEMVEEPEPIVPPEDGEDDSGLPSPEAETIDIPISLLQGKPVNPGDVVRLEVLTANADSGTITARYAVAPEKPDGIRKMASKFEE